MILPLTKGSLSLALLRALLFCSIVLFISVFSFTSQLRHEILVSAMLEVQNNVV